MNSADWLEFRMTSWRLSICGWAWMCGLFVGIHVMLGALLGVLALWMGASMDAGRLIGSGIRGLGLSVILPLVVGLLAEAWWRRRYRLQVSPLAISETRLFGMRTLNFSRAFSAYIKRSWGCGRALVLYGPETKFVIPFAQFSSRDQRALADALDAWLPEEVKRFEGSIRDNLMTGASLEHSSA